MADAKGIMAGRAFVQLFADDAALQKGLKAAEKSVKGFGVSVGKIGASIGAMGAAITVPLIAAVNMFAESGSALAHMSARTGASVEVLSALGYAAKLSGTDLESVEIGIKRMQKALTAGSEESMAAVGTFNALGLSIQQLMRLKPDEQFNVIARRIGAIQNPTARAGAALTVFGRSGTALLPLIENMDRLTGEAKRLGLVTSTEAAKGALALEQSMIKLEIISKKIMTTIGSALAPMFEAWNNKLIKVEKSVLDLVKANKPLIVTIASVGFALVAAGTAITALGVAIFGLGQIIGVVSAVIGVIYSALLLLTTPLGLIAVGFVGMTIAMGKWGDMVKGISDFIKTNFAGTLGTIKDTIKGVSDALQAGDIQLATKVLFAGLKVEVLRGTTELTKIWADYGVAVAEVFRGISFNIASHLIDIQSAIEKIAAQAGSVAGTGSLASVAGKALGIKPLIDKAFDAAGEGGKNMANNWDAALTQMKLNLIKMTGTAKFEWQKFTNLITGTFTDAQKQGKSLLPILQAAAAAHAATMQGFAERRAAREKAGVVQSPEEAAKEQAEQNKALAEIEKRRQEAQAALDSGENAEVANRRKAAADAMAAAENDLELAKLELQRKKKQAAEEAGAPEAFGEGGMGPGKAGAGEPPMTPEGLDEGLKQAAAKVDVKGTFSGLQASLTAGTESVQGKQLEESKKHTKALDDIKKNTAKQQVFAN